MKRSPDHPISRIRATGDAQWCWSYTKLPDHERRFFFQSCINNCDLPEGPREIWIKAFEVLRDYSRKELEKFAGDRFTLRTAFNWSKEKEKQRIKIAERRQAKKNSPPVCND